MVHQGRYRLISTAAIRNTLNEISRNVISIEYNRVEFFFFFNI